MDNNHWKLTVGNDYPITVRERSEDTDTYDYSHCRRRPFNWLSDRRYCEHYFDIKYDSSLNNDINSVIYTTLDFIDTKGNSWRVDLRIEPALRMLMDSSEGMQDPSTQEERNDTILEAAPLLESILDKFK